MSTIYEKMTAVANAVRAKTGGTSSLTLDQMASGLNAIPNKTSSDLTVSGATVTIPAGNYKSQATKSVSTATRADTTISVSADDTNDKLTITASNNQGTGYVTGANKTATKTITLTASGSSVTASDGTNSVSKSVATATQATPSISVNSSGLITASATQTAGYVSAGTKSATKQLTTQAAKTVTPSTSSQTAVASGVYTTGAITVAAMPTATQATPSISIDSAGKITASATQTAGYVSAGTKTGTKQLTTQAAKTITPSTSSQTAVASGVYTTGAVTVAAIPSSYVKPSATKAAATITPGTSNQTIAAGTYCSGAQTIAGDADLVASNIKKGANIFGVAGSYEGAELNFNVVGGTSTPSSPTENTIWVNTSTSITGWNFSANEPSTWKLCSAAGEVLGSIDGYTLKKKNAGNAVFAFASNENYAIPMLISDNKNAAIISRSDGTTIDAGTTYSYNGKTYYLTFPGYNLNSFNTLIPKYTDSNDPYKAIEFLVDKLLNQKQAEGIVWISTGTSSNTDFNALKSNNIQVYPKSAKQYINGAWVAKTGKAYQGGAWKGWAHYLIGNGVNAQTVTGDFDIYDGFRTFNSDGSVFLRHPYGDATNKHDYATKNTFDVTNYTKLVVRATAWDTNEAFYVGVNTVANKGQQCISRVAIGNVPATVTLDISSITGYVCFQVDMPYYGTSITLSEVYFE